MNDIPSSSSSGQNMSQISRQLNQSQVAWTGGRPPFPGQVGVGCAVSGARGPWELGPPPGLVSAASSLHRPGLRKGGGVSPSPLWTFSPLPRSAEGTHPAPGGRHEGGVHWAGQSLVFMVPGPLFPEAGGPRSLGVTSGRPAPSVQVHILQSGCAHWPESGLCPAGQEACGSHRQPQVGPAPGC